MNELLKIGIYVDVSRGDGGSFQYIQFILDAASKLTDKYIFTVFYLDPGFEEIMNRDYPMLGKQRIKVLRSDIPAYIDSFSQDYIMVPLSLVSCWIGAELRTPLIGVIHDVNPFYFNYYYENGVQMTDAYVHLFQKVVRKSSGVFVDSELGVKELSEAVGGIYKDRMIPMPFRAPDYLDEDRPEEPVDLKNQKFIFYPAQFWPHKNFTNLLLAMEELKEQGVVVNILFTGGESLEKERVMRLVDKLGLDEQVQFSGRVTDAQMKYLYHHARGMVFSGYLGPTNIPLYEAMYTGCPMAVPHVRYMPWQAQDAALFFDPRYPDSIAESMRRLWEDDALCDELSIKGKERYKEFDKDKFNERFKYALQDIIRKNRESTRYVNAIKNFCSRFEKIVLYGAGEFSCWMQRFLELEGISISMIIVSNRDENTACGGYRLLSLSEAEHLEEKCGIILCGSETLHDGMLQALKTIGIDEENCLKMTYEMYESLIAYVSDRR